MLIFDNLHLHDDMDLSSHSVKGVKDGEPAIQGVLGATVGQGVETDIYFANGIVSSVRVMVHQSVGMEGCVRVCVCVCVCACDKCVRQECVCTCLLTVI